MTNSPPTWSELSVMEWESNLGSLNDRNAILNETESNLSHTKLSDFKSPASIILFSSLYNILSAAKLSEYPVLDKFFSGFLGTEFAKHGIELASAHTAKQKVDASTFAGASPSTSKGPGPASRHLRPGIFANLPNGKKMHSLLKILLTVVCQFPVSATSLSHQLYPM